MYMYTNHILVYYREGLYKLDLSCSPTLFPISNAPLTLPFPTSQSPAKYKFKLELTKLISVETLEQGNEYLHLWIFPHKNLSWDIIF